MSVQSDQLKERTMAFAVLCLRVVDGAPRTPVADVVARQLAKSATSVAANYRATCGARSRAEFIAKLCIVVEEAEECVYWLDLILRSQMFPPLAVVPVRAEAAELRAIFAKSLGTARSNFRHRKSMTKCPNDHMTT